MVSVSVKLSDWLFRAVMAKSVLTLSRDYFRLRKPLERRIYELARKHCGRQRDWKVSLEVLLKKSGSTSPRRVFRKMIRNMIAADHLPDYEMVEEEGDIIRFIRRGQVIESYGAMPQLDPDTLDAARALAPGWDIYVLESDWKGYWADTGRPKLANPDKAFLGYVRARMVRGGDGTE